MAHGSLPQLKKPAAPAKAAVAPKAPAVTPVYDPKKCSALVGGVGLVQGKYAFSERGFQFIREVPQEQWYFLTPEQEINYTRQMAKQKQTLRQNLSAAEPPVPQKVIQMARENAQALAAEAYSE